MKRLRAGAAMNGNDVLAMMIGNTKSIVDVFIVHHIYNRVYPTVDAIKPMINMVISETPTDDIQYMSANKKIQIPIFLVSLNKLFNH